MSEQVHSLMSLDPVEESCEEAIAHWNDSRTMKHRLGTLHTILTADHVGKESVPFLMELADGWTCSSNFQVYGKTGGEERAKNRQKIAEKAFDVLCARFFGHKKNDNPMWWWMLGNQEVFDKTLWFLRANDNRIGRCTLRNYRGDDEKPQMRTFGKFLADFAELAWEHGRYDFRGFCQDEVVERLKDARPRLVDILAATHNLHWLLKKKTLDRGTRQALKSLVFRYELYLPKADDVLGETHRVPKTLQEALYGGSQAAQVLLLYGLLRDQCRIFATARREVARTDREQERQARLRELAERRRQLNEQEAQLLGKAD